MRLPDKDDVFDFLIIYHLSSKIKKTISKEKWLLKYLYNYLKTYHAFGSKKLIVHDVDIRRYFYNCYIYHTKMFSKMLFI